MLGQQVIWTADAAPARLAVIVAEVWKTAPFVGLLTLAGLALIPNEVYEAARVDGATAWRQFWHITLPVVRPALLFRLLDALRMFDRPFVLVGPRKQEVETLTMLAFGEATNVRHGSATTFSVLLFGYVAVVAFVLVKIPRTKEVFTTAMLTFVVAWNEFIIALSMLNEQDMQTVTVAISKFTGAQGFERPFGTRMAAGVVVTVPLLIAVLLGQRRIVPGLTAGGVK